MKSSLRIRYEAESEVIRKKIGGLEDVRKDLGLSQRKMCQLLMVDPSAWSRWVKEPDKVPPHIYRTLQWYLALIDRQPDWHTQNAFLGAFRAPSQPNMNQLKSQLRAEVQKAQLAHSSEAEKLIAELRVEKESLLETINRQSQVLFSWKMVVLFNTVIVIYLLLFS